MSNFLKSDDGQQAALFCSCGCYNGVTMKFDKEDQTFFLSLVSDDFYTMQTTALRRFVEKIKRIWCVIRNKEYSYTEIVIEKDDLDAFKEFVANL